MRASDFAFILDVAGSEGRHPIEDLQNLRREIDFAIRAFRAAPMWSQTRWIFEAADNLRANNVSDQIAISADRSDGIERPGSSDGSIIRQKKRRGKKWLRPRKS
jgi:hypothetical protein